MTAALLASPVNTRPTLRIDGRRHEAADELLQAMTVREALGGLSSLEITFRDFVSQPGAAPAFAFGDSRILKFGADIKAYAGDIAAPQEIFRGRISALECEADDAGAPLFTALAEDRLQSAHKTRRSRTFDNASPADIVRKIAADHNLTPVIGAGLDQPKTTFVQMNQSDLAFLRWLLARFDADAQVVGDELQASGRARNPRGEVELRLHDNLLSVRIVADLAGQTPETRSAGWDPASGSAVDGKATGGELGPGGGRTSASLVEQALGAGPREAIGHLGAMKQGEADLIARAAFSRRARRFLRASGRCAGNAALRVGATVKLKGVNPQFEGAYCVTAATHRYDQRTGYITEFAAESAFFGGGG